MSEILENRTDLLVFTVATDSGRIVYYHYISFGTEMYLSRAKTVTVCSLSYSWWEGPDVLDFTLPELLAGRSGPLTVRVRIQRAFC